MKKRYVFICGCPRSGTTELAFLLSSHPAVVIGVERYKYFANRNKINLIQEDLFESDRFFNLKEEETNILPARSERFKKYYERMEIKYSKASILGDKYPDYFRFYRHLLANISDSKIIYLLRDIIEVAASWNTKAENPKDHWPSDANYKMAVQRWNESLEETFMFHKLLPDRIFVCDYDRIFSGDRRYLSKLLKFIGIKKKKELEEYYAEAIKNYLRIKERRKNINPDQIAFLEKKAKISLAENLLREQLI
jgi:hypothetical protein